LVGRKQKNKIEKTLKEIDWRYVAKITETNLQKNFKEVLINSSALGNRTNSFNQHFLKRKNTGVYSGLE